MIVMSIIQTPFKADFEDEDEFEFSVKRLSAFPCHTSSGIVLTSVEVSIFSGQVQPDPSIPGTY